MDNNDGLMTVNLKNKTGGSSMKREEFLKLVDKKDFKAIKSVLNVMNVVELADLLSELEETEAVIAFRLMEKYTAAEVFSHVDSNQQAELLNLFTDKEIKDMMDAMFSDDAADLVEEMPANVVEKLLRNMDAETRSEINSLLNYPEDSAGSIMTTEYISLAPNIRIGDALRKIREEGIHKETIYTCYVVHNHILQGIVTAKDLLTNPEDMPISDIIEENIITCHTNDDKEDVAKKFNKYGLISMPVVDAESCIVGIVTFDDAFEVLETEVTEDFEKMNAILHSDETYFNTGVFRHAGNRIPWLLVLMITSTLTGIIITRYENAFEAIPLLVAFMPMLMDTGGNCGAQSLALIIRGLAIDEIKPADALRVWWKEFRVAAIISIILAVANGVRIYFMHGRDLRISLVVSGSLIVTVFIAKTVGCMLPLLAKKMKMDPAVMASPMITTIVDVCSLFIYFNIATHIFNI